MGWPGLVSAQLRWLGQVQPKPREREREREVNWVASQPKPD